MAMTADEQSTSTDVWMRLPQATHTGACTATTAAGASTTDNNTPAAGATIAAAASTAATGGKQAGESSNYYLTLEQAKHGELPIPKPLRIELARNVPL